MGANYKLSELEFNAKVVQYVKYHENCEKDVCLTHADVFFKKLIL